MLVAQTELVLIDEPFLIHFYFQNFFVEVKDASAKNDESFYNKK